MHREADVFARYLVGAPPSEPARALYERAAGATPDDVLVRFALARPRSIPYLDAGLALLDRHAELRRRLHLMLAILESTPEHHARFLPAPHGPLYVVVVLGACLRGVLRAAVGVALVRRVARGA